jgi:hypothetical protein
MKNATANIKAALLLLYVDRSKKLERGSLAYFLISPVGRRLEDDSECNANICALGAFYCNIKVIQFWLLRALRSHSKSRKLLSRYCRNVFDFGLEKII